MTQRRSAFAIRYFVAARVCIPAAVGLLPLAAAADAEFVITVQNGRFHPTHITVPAGQKVVLIIDNLGDAIEEFESYDLDREKVIAPKSRATIFIGPLKPGRYQFLNEFNKKAPPGTLVAEELAIPPTAPSSAP